VSITILLVLAPIGAIVAWWLSQQRLTDSLLLRDKRDFAANGALIIRGALDEAEPPQLVIQREMMRRIAWTGVQAAEAINPSGFLRARRTSANAPRKH
jgi:hypothetical protein